MLDNAVKYSQPGSRVRVRLSASPRDAAGGQLLSHITNDVGQVHMAVSETITDLISESFLVVGYAGFLFYLDWKLAIVCICTVRSL